MTDHHPLQYLDAQKSLSRKQARRVEFMQEFNYSINYIEGKSEIVADALSRKNKTAHQKSTEMFRTLLCIPKVKISDEATNKLKAGYKNDEDFIEKIGSY